MSFGLNGRTESELEIDARRELHAVLEGRGDQDGAGEQPGVAAGQVVGDEPAHAFARGGRPSFPGRSRPIDLPQREDVPVPDLERIDVAARPLRRPAEAAELEGVRGETAGREVSGQEIPAGRVGAEPVDEEEDGFG